MPLTIASNIVSLKAQRRLGETSSALSKVYERLSSGQRINSSADDAAGLAISERLNADTRVFTQAVRNINDGISLTNIADSALENLGNIVSRIRELAEQSANGSYSNTQRKALDAEAQALSTEYLRIAKSTSFNGQKLFDGSYSALTLQVGYGSEGSLQSTLGGAIGTGSFTNTGTYSSGPQYAIVSGDLNGDGIADLVTGGAYGGAGKISVRLGTGNGNFGAATSYSSEATSTFSLALGDINGDGFLDLVSAGDNSGVGGATVRLGTGTGSFGSATAYATESQYSIEVALGDLNGDGFLDLVTAGAGSGGRATVRLGNGSGSFGSATSYTTEGAGSSAVALGDLNGDGILDLVTSGEYGSGLATVRLGTGSGSFGSATSYTTTSTHSYGVELGDLNGDGILDLVTAGQSGAAGYAVVRLGAGNGSFGAATSYATESGGSNDLSLRDYNGDGFLDLLSLGTGTSNLNIRFGQGNGTFGSSQSISTSASVAAVASADFNADGVLDFAALDANPNINIYKEQTTSGVGALLSYSLKSLASARQAIPQLEQAQNLINAQRGVVGAFQSRLSYTSNAIQASAENFSAAASRIRDADIASDASNLVRLQVLQNAGVAVLAQANQQPSLVLSLLKNT